MEWLALIGPPLLWVNIAWVSPFVRSHRHGLSASLSLITGSLMFACLRAREPTAGILFWTGVIAMAAMLAALLWPQTASAKRKGS